MVIRARGWSRWVALLPSFAGLATVAAFMVGWLSRQIFGLLMLAYGAVMLVWTVRTNAVLRDRLRDHDKDRPW